MNELIFITHSMELIHNIVLKNEDTFYKRKEVTNLLNITTDTLRNWELNGLLKVKKKENE